MVAAGEALARAQAKYPPRGWLKWLAANCPTISDDTTRLYILCYQNPEPVRQFPTFTQAVEGITNARRDHTAAKLPKVKPASPPPKPPPQPLTKPDNVIKLRTGANHQKPATLDKMMDSEPAKPG